MKTSTALANREHGTIPVPMRDADGKFVIEEGKPKLAQIAMGLDLISEVNDRFTQIEGSDQPLPFSRALRRYLGSEGVDLPDVLKALGVDDLGRTSVQRFLTNTGLRPLFSPVVEDGIRLGLNQIAPYWEGLIARNVPIDRLNYEYYQFDNTTTQDKEFELRQVGQGAPIPTAKVSLAGKSYTLTKMGRGIEWTDEAKMAPIDLAGLWFQQLGVKLGWQFHDIAVDRLLNGYFSDGSDAAPTDATAVSGTITEKDLFNAQAQHLVDFGYQDTIMLASRSTAVDIKTMTYANGAPVFPAGVEDKGLPPLAIARNLADDRVIFVDTNFALVRLEARPFGTEFQRNVQTQVEGSYGTEISLIVPMFKDARFVLTI